MIERKSNPHSIIDVRVSHASRMVRAIQASERGGEPQLIPRLQKDPHLRGCAEMETPKPLCLKPGAGHLPVLTTKIGEKKTQPLKKGQNLCHSCQPANIHRKFTGLRNACGQMSAWDAIAQAPPTAFWQSCSPGMAAGLGWVLEKAAPHHPPHFFACSCGTAVSGPFMLQRALENEPKHTLGTARSSSALFGGDTVAHGGISGQVA